MSLNTHISSPFVKRNYNSSTCLSHEKTCGEMKEDRGKWRAGKMVPKGATRREGGKEEGGGSREREESGKCTFFFFVVGAHARAIVCLRVLTSKLVLSNGNKTSE